MLTRSLSLRWQPRCTVQQSAPVPHWYLHSLRGSSGFLLMLNFPVQFCSVIVLPLNPFESLVLRDRGDLDWPANDWRPRQKARKLDCGMHQKLRQIDCILYRHGCENDLGLQLWPQHIQYLIGSLGWFHDSL